MHDTVISLTGVKKITPMRGIDEKKSRSSHQVFVKFIKFVIISDVL